MLEFLAETKKERVSRMDWLYELPLWGFGFLVVGMFVGGSIGGLLCFWRVAHGRLHLKEETNNDVIFFCSAIGVFYSLTVSLIAVATWDNHSRVEEVVSQEAVTLAVLYRDVSSYPEPAHSELQSQLRDYIRYVIDQASGHCSDEDSFLEKALSWRRYSRTVSCHSSR